MNPKQQAVKDMTERMARLNAELSVLKDWRKSIRPLDEISLAEKALKFDKLYKQAFEYVKDSVEQGYEVKDGDHYLYEAVIEETLGSDVFKVINAILV